MAIPYPSDILIPYLIEPVGEFLNAWGPPVLFPIAHWLAWVTIGLSSIMVIKIIWWDVSTGGPLNRVQRKIALSHQKMEADRQAGLRKISEKYGLHDATNPVGENQQRQ